MQVPIRLRVLGVATVAIGALALPADAFAAPPPEPVDPTIEVPASIGGATVGQAPESAEEAWGNTGKCEEVQPSQRTCNYGGQKQGDATLISYQGVVALVTIMAPFNKGEFSFKGPLMDFRTDEGNLGLGSKLTKVAKHFPRAKYVKKWSVTARFDGIEMVFFSSDKKHVTQIVARDGGIN